MTSSAEGLLEELRKCETRYRTTLDSMSDAIHVVDEDLEIVLFNRRFRLWCEELGLSTEVEGKSVFEAFPFLPPSVADEYRQVFEDGEVLVSEEHLELGGKKLVAEVCKIPAVRDGRIDNVVTVVRDITERKREEEALRRSEQRERYFREELTRLHEVTNKLSKVRSFDGLCRTAIELGRERLGFDRLSIWFVHDDGRSALGSYGVDEEGQVRDERGQLVAAPPGSPMGQVLLQKKPWLLLEDSALFDHGGQAIGRGAACLAPLWDGENVIGFAIADNLLRQAPITEQQCEILALYASAIAHLCSCKQIEGALDIERRQLLSIFDGMDEPVYVSDPKTYDVLYANESLRSKFGDIVDRKCFEALQGLNAPCSFCTNDRILGEHFGEPYLWEHQNQINGRWYHCIDKAIRWPDGRIVRCEMAIDITDRKRSEEERETLARLGTRLAGATSAEMLVTAVREESERLLGWDAHYLALRRSEDEDFHVVSAVDLIDGEKRILPGQAWPAKDVSEPVLGVLAGEPALINREPGDTDPALIPFGDERRLSASMVHVPVRSGEAVIGVLSAQSYTHYRYGETDVAVLQRIADATAPALERVRAEEVLRESERRFRDLFEGCADAIFVEDLEGNVLDVNPAACRLHQMAREDLVGKNVLDLVPPEQREEVARDFPKLTTGEWDHAEGVSWTRDGRAVPVELRASRIEYRERPALLLHVRDLSERRRIEEERRQLEAQMQHADKLKSLGVLAGGVAHDFNNLLTAILGNAGLALSFLAPDAEARKCVEQIRSASLRAAEITNQMLAYAGQSTFVVEPIGLSQMAKEMSHLLHTCIPKKVALEYDLQPDLPAIEADAGQIRQVIMNLITNAAEAIGDQAGTVTVRTGVREIDEAYPSAAWMDDELEPGPYVFLEVTDTGCGMSPETQARIFEPFFTTKFTGRGLGLAGMLGIVRGHDGTIEVNSTPDVGTTFRVLFPYSGVSPPPLGQEARDESRWQGEGTILVVDDEEGVRDVMESTLERCGLHVLTATNGREAVEMFAERSQEIAAVILDLTMPQMDGEETLREIRKLQPSARVVLTSGFGEEEASARLAGADVAGFVKKPFKLTDLVDTVRAALEDAS